MPTGNTHKTTKRGDLIVVSGHHVGEPERISEISRELGAVPPFAGAFGDRVLVDTKISESESVLLDAGTHEQSLRLQTADLVALSEALLADLCRD
jgi:prolyl-tRNA editing enzyme YbaK/EbsC (Cys-tRNA(Pro) deacylase)